MRTRIVLTVMAFIALFGVTPLMAQQPEPVWQADYFNNLYFLNSPVLSRFEARIGYDWGTASPGTSVPSDNFSARWGTTVNLAAGTYRFYVMADDEVKVMLDFGNPIISTFGNARVGQMLTQDVNLNGGQHHIQIDYREFSGAASIFFSFEGLADGVQGPVFTTLPVPPPPPVPPVSDLYWLGEYFNNRTLSGTPVMVLQETDPTHNWGEVSPDPRISNSDFTVRWTRNIGTPGGVFRLRAVADDGVRVYVDNALILDEWHISTGEVFVKDFSLSAGVHNIRVEYMEVGGAAFLEFSLTGNTPPPSNVPVTASVTINTGRLNVRSQPNPFSSILTRVNFGETLPALGTNAARTWVQINVNGTIGWVSARLVRLNNAANLPVVSGAGSGTVTPTGFNVLADRFTVNIRTGPGTQFRVIGTLRLNQNAQLIGRNINNTWWKVNYQGIVGWVSAVYTRIDSSANIASIPVSG